jgi:hypothetical protein
LLQFFHHSDVGDAGFKESAAFLDETQLKVKVSGFRLRMQNAGLRAGPDGIGERPFHQKSAHLPIPERDANRYAFEFQFSGTQRANPRRADGIIADPCEIMPAFRVKPVEFEIPADALFVAKDLYPDREARIDIGLLLGFDYQGFGHLQVRCESGLKG